MLKIPMWLVVTVLDSILLEHFIIAESPFGQHCSKKKAAHLIFFLKFYRLFWWEVCCNNHYNY